jgi:hypothetical protein
MGLGRQHALHSVAVLALSTGIDLFAAPTMAA